MSLIYTEGYLESVSIIHEATALPKGTFKIYFNSSNESINIRIYEKTPYDLSYSFYLGKYPLEIDIDPKKNYFIDTISSLTEKNIVFAYFK